MIHDRLTYASAYCNLAPALGVALAYLQQTDLTALPTGRHVVATVADGDIVAIVDRYSTRPAEDRPWEAHRAHIDVQCVVEGTETIGLGDLSTFRCGPYDAARDMTPVTGGVERWVTVQAGEFLVIWPHEAHLSGVATGAPSAVRKVVLKVPVGDGARAAAYS